MQEHIKNVTNIRAGASTSYSKIGGYAKGSIVTISEESNGFGKTNKGWISLKYTSRINEEESIKDQTVGQIKKLARASTLYSNSNLTGYKYNYKLEYTFSRESIILLFSSTKIMPLELF